MLTRPHGPRPPHRRICTEIEISPLRSDDARSHKQVHAPERPTLAVFDSVPEGEYTLWLDGAPPAARRRGECHRHLIQKENTGSA
jgi:hypothetical protein